MNLLLSTNSAAAPKIPGCHAHAAWAWHPSILIAISILFAAAPAYAEGPLLDRFFPAGIERGGQVRVQAIGRLGGWPLKGWADRPGLSIEPLAEPGSLLIRAEADAEPGVHWVRLYGAAGASELRPLVVGMLPELSDQEPNDTWRAAQQLEHAACTINGRLAAPGDCDVFATHVQAGQTLVAWVDAEHSLGSPMDGVLQILDSSGTVVAQNHDSIGLDPCTTVEARSDGMYFVRLFAFPAKATAAIQLAGGDDFVYRLTVTSQAAIRCAFPLSIARSGRQAVQLRGWNLAPAQSMLTLDPPAGRDTLTVFRPQVAGRTTLRIEDEGVQVECEPNPPEHANVIHVPGCTSGMIGAPGDEDSYAFSLQDGQTVCFRLESVELGFPLDGVLTLDDVDGNRLAAADDTEGRRDPELMYTAALGGPFRLTVRDLYGHGGWQYAYRLRATLAEPDFAIKVASGLWSATVGGQAEIPVTVERRNGCPFPIRVTLAGLPATASCPWSESQAGGTSAGHVMLKLTAGSQPFAGPIQIIGTALGGQPIAHRAQAEIEGFGRKTDQLWLTIRASATGQESTIKDARP